MGNLGSHWQEEANRRFAEIEKYIDEEYKPQYESERQHGLTQAQTYADYKAEKAAEIEARRREVHQDIYCCIDNAL